MIMKYNDSQTKLQQLKDLMQQVVTERDWQQFHSLKNLAMGLSIEAGELLEHFLWVKDEDSLAVMETNRQDIENEVADVFLCLLNFCNAANIDASSAMVRKLEEVKRKYPIEKAKGVSTKYNKL